MAEQTSIDAYHRLVEVGAIAEIQRKVLAVFRENGPLTAGEMALRLPDYENDSVRNRCAELERLGLIRSRSKRVCSVTHISCKLWESIGDFSFDEVVLKSQTKPLTKSQQLAELRAENTRLAERLAYAIERYQALAATVL